MYVCFVWRQSEMTTEHIWSNYWNSVSYNHHTDSVFRSILPFFEEFDNIVYQIRIQYIKVSSQLSHICPCCLANMWKVKHYYQYCVSEQAQLFLKSLPAPSLNSIMYCQEDENTQLIPKHDKQIMGLQLNVQKKKGWILQPIKMKPYIRFHKLKISSNLWKNWQSAVLF